MAAVTSSEAGPTRFDFTLTTDTDLRFDGQGFFIIDDPVPTIGTVVLVASDMRGSVGDAWLFNSPAPFGYEFGNTHEFLVGDPPLPPHTEFIRSPHNDALVTFSDGVPTGISYSESHTCDTEHHCTSEITNAVPFLLMTGEQYLASAAFLDGTGGTISIAQAVPEGGTLPLMLAGLVTLFASMARLRCPGFRSTSI